MHPLVQHAPPVRTGLCLWRQCALMAICGLLVGCESLKSGVGISAPYKPDNVYHSFAALPFDVKRVAVLPLGADQTREELVVGRDALEPILKAELIKTKKFEVVRPAPEALHACTGRETWTGEEALPSQFLSSLQENYGCDAVLFCRLTVYRAYPPLAVGWRMKLVEAGSGRMLWAGDEVFDWGDPAVREGARRYQKSQRSRKYQSGRWTIENSPRRFGQYSLAQLFATLPER